MRYMPLSKTELQALHDAGSTTRKVTRRDWRGFCGCGWEVGDYSSRGAAERGLLTHLGGRHHGQPYFATPLSAHKEGEE